MAPKKASIGYVGYAELVPSDQIISSSSSRRGRHVSVSDELESAAKVTFKDSHGSRNSGKFTESYKAEEFVDKSSGRLGYKEEAKYSSSYKYHDKDEGYTHEFQEQVKYKHVAYPTANNAGSSKNKNSNTKRVAYY